RQRIACSRGLAVQALGVAGISAYRIDAHEASHALGMLPVDGVIGAGFGVALVAREVVLLLCATLPELLAEWQGGLAAKHSAVLAHRQPRTQPVAQQERS